MPRILARLSRARTLSALTACTLALVLLPGLPIQPSAAANAASSCASYKLLGSRGSGEADAAKSAELGDGNNGLGKPVAQLRNALPGDLPATATFDWVANPYPAVGVSDGADSNGDSWMWNLLGAGTGFDIGRYKDSVAEGKDWLHRAVDAEIAACPTTQLILAGYSQGAQVTADVYQSLTAAQLTHVFGMVAFGDPLFNGKSQAGAGDYDPNRNGSVRTQPIGSSVRPEYANVGNGKVISYCHSKDPVCQGIFSWSFSNPWGVSFSQDQHTNYHEVGDSCGTRTYPQRAAGHLGYRAGNHAAAGGPIAVLTPVEDTEAGDTVALSAASSCHEANRPLTYAWDLDGSGNYATAGNGPEIGKTFATGGTFTVGVKVTDDQGQSATATTTVTVGGADAYTGVPGAPTNVVSTPAADSSAATLTWQPPSFGPPAEGYLVRLADGTLLGSINPGQPLSLTVPAADLPIDVVVQSINREGEGGVTAAVAMKVAVGGLGAPDAVPGRFIVELAETAALQSDGVAATAQRLATVYGGTVHHLYTEAPRGFSVGGLAAADATRMAADPAVTLVSPVRTVEEAAVQADPPNWGLDRIDQRALPLDQRYAYPDDAGAGVRIYVVDGGVRVTHQEFAGRASNGYAVSGQSGETQDFAPCGDHGTAVAGLAAGSRFGVAKQAQIVSVKVRVCPRKLDTEDLIEGLDWVEADATKAGAPRSVVNISLGTRALRTNGEDREDPLENKVTAMLAKGIPVVAAAGNGEGGQGKTACAVSPANIPGVISVSAVDQTDTRVSWAGFGRCVTLFAPGVDVPALGSGSDSAPARLSSGTSFAAPHAAGAAALVLARHPAYSAAQVRDTLMADASTPGNTGQAEVVHKAGWNSPDRLLYIPPPGTSGSPVRVMLVGDSITQGSAGDYTWRYRLDKHLTASGVDPVFVGPYTDLYDNVAGEWNDNHTYIDPDFDQRHDAVWGRSLQDAASKIAGDVSSYKPDYLLVLLGVNDMGWGISDAAGTEASLKAFIANARAAEPGIRFVFAKIPPDQRRLDDPAFEAMITDFNNRLAADAASLSTPRSTIAVTEAGQDIVPSADLWDGVHPDSQGEVKIAAGFADTLAARFGIGAAYPRPYPSVPLGPRTVPQLTLGASGNGQATLSWTAAPGATGYYVYLKNVTAGENAFTKLPWPVTGTSWVAEGLVPGARYDVQLGTTKGYIEGVKSNVASVDVSGTVPAAVTDLAATASGDNQATLTWSPAANATGYLVLVKNVSAGETAFTKLPYPVTGTSWVASGLVPGAQYQFQLQSANGLVNGPVSNTASVTVTGATPAAVSNLAATASGNNQATLTWSPAANATGYFVLVKNVSAGETAFTKLPYPVTGTSWVASGLVPGAQYQFQLQTANGLVNGPVSNTASVTVTGATPAAVTNLSAATSGNNQATLSWTPVANATGYFILVKNVTAGEAVFTKLPYPVSGPTWVAGGLVAGHQYQFQVQGANGYLNGQVSNTATVTATGAAPAAVTNLTATASAAGQATLSWTQVANATGYYVWVRNVSAGEAVFTRLPSAVAGPSWVDTGLVPGGQYQFQVQSVNGAINGPVSNTASVTVTGASPAGVTNLSASPSGNNQVTLSWTPVANATGYWVLAKNVSAGETSFTRLPIAISGPTWVASGLIAGGQYQYQLQSVNGYINGGYSNTATVTVTGASPAGVTNLSASPSGNNQVTLSWTPVANATGYWVLAKNVSAGETSFTRLPIAISGPTWVASGLIAGGQYQYQLQSVNGYINGGYSNTATVTVTGPTPSGVTNLTTTASAYNQSTLSWSPVANATGYWVWFRNVSAGESSFTRLPVPVSGPTWVAGGLIAGGQYQFQLQSVNGYINGGYSNTATVTVTGASPAGVGNLAVTVNPGNFKLSWTSVAHATGYFILMKSPGDSVFTRLPYPVSGSPWTISPPILSSFPVGTYQFQLQSVNGYLMGGLSNLVTVTKTLPPLASPTGLTAWTSRDTPAGVSAQCGAFLGPSCSVRMSWNTVTGADSYDVYASNDSRVDSQYAYIGNSTGSSGTFTYPVAGNAQNRITYHVVARRGADGASSPSSMATTITVGDYGGPGTDCWIKAGLPYLSGGQVLFTGSVTCPRSLPIETNVQVNGFVDQHDIENGDDAICWSPSCSVTATSTPLSGSHCYGTTMSAHVVMESGNPVSGGITKQLSTYYCKTLSG